MSSRVMVSRPPVEARMEDGVSSCTTYRSEVFAPISPSSASASSSMLRLSVCDLMLTTWTISSTEYGMVRTMTRRSRRSTGMPWGETMSVPRMVQMPLLVAKTTIGLRVDSRALFKYVKHSMSSMCTSSMKSTPGTSSAIPWSMYLLTTLLISSLSFSVTSVFFGFMKEPMMEAMSPPPCGLAFAWSRSCRVTSCTISFFLCTSPLGTGTYSSASRSNSVAYWSLLPTRLAAPLFASM
mmetsp:Transcript_26387/g.78632  ORF Transcript_26387/g.78632 Transcript_26387/m.78632 type:complete len:238 (+) Transcript_26387:162-875(+)